MLYYVILYIALGRRVHRKIAQETPVAYQDFPQEVLDLGPSRSCHVGAVVI